MIYYSAYLAQTYFIQVNIYKKKNNNNNVHRRVPAIYQEKTLYLNSAK